MENIINFPLKIKNKANMIQSAHYQRIVAYRRKKRKDGEKRRKGEVKRERRGKEEGRRGRRNKIMKNWLGLE